MPCGWRIGGWCLDCPSFETGEEGLSAVSVWQKKKVRKKEKKTPPLRGVSAAPVLQVRAGQLLPSPPLAGQSIHPHLDFAAPFETAKQAAATRYLARCTAYCGLYAHHPLLSLALGIPLLFPLCLPLHPDIILLLCKKLPILKLPHVAG